MLNLDGAALDMNGREFSYDLPKPWGPKRGPAVFKVTAKPAASINAEFRRAFDDLMHKATVNDLTVEKQFEGSGDIAALVKARTEKNKWITEAIAALRYDHCVISWKTDIQNGGKPLEPTRENFLALAAFEHPDITALFAKVNADLSNFDKFSLDAETEAARDEEKN